MPFLRFSRDKRGYEHIYLVHAGSRKGKPGRARVLYWYRSPPGVKVGRAPFDAEVRKSLEAQYPGITFDWKTYETTPAPPPEPEHWRERRRAEKAAKLARRGEDVEPEESSQPEIGDAGDPGDPGDIVEPAEELNVAEQPAGAVAAIEATADIEPVEAVRASVVEETTESLAIPEPGAAPQPAATGDPAAPPFVERRRRRRRRGGRRRHGQGAWQGAQSPTAPAGESSVPREAPETSENLDEPPELPGDTSESPDE